MIDFSDYSQQMYLFKYLMQSLVSVAPYQLIRMIFGGSCH